MEKKRMGTGPQDDEWKKTAPASGRNRRFPVIWGDGGFFPVNGPPAEDCGGVPGQPIFFYGENQPRRFSWPFSPISPDESNPGGAHRQRPPGQDSFYWGARKFLREFRSFGLAAPGGIRARRNRWSEGKKGPRFLWGGLKPHPTRGGIAAVQWALPTGFLARSQIDL